MIISGLEPTFANLTYTNMTKEALVASLVDLSSGIEITGITASSHIDKCSVTTLGDIAWALHMRMTMALLLLMFISFPTKALCYHQEIQRSLNLKQITTTVQN
jgi:hypothetical protein